MERDDEPEDNVDFDAQGLIVWDQISEEIVRKIPWVDKETNNQKIKHKHKNLCEKTNDGKNYGGRSFTISEKIQQSISNFSISFWSIGSISSHVMSLLRPLYTKYL